MLAQFHATALPLWGQQVRGMATLKDISVRLKSVKNMQKITQSMKMVSAAKYARAERDLKQARPYGQGANAFYEKANCKVEPEAIKKRLLVAITSDKGLCGGCHSSICKAIRHELRSNPDKDYKIIAIGDKARAQLVKEFGKKFIAVVGEVGRRPPIFQDAGKIADAILSSGYEFDTGVIYYNMYRSVVSYRTTEIPLFSQSLISTSEKFPLYDSMDSEVLQNYLEYSLASLIYHAMKEGNCSEESARMTAMDSASKNAGEMIGKLTLTFNRTRQAVITRELIEIISGAAAL